MSRTIQSGKGGDGGAGGSIIIGADGKNGADGANGSASFGSDGPNLWFHAVLLSLAMFAAAAHVAEAIDDAAERCVTVEGRD